MCVMSRNSSVHQNSKDSPKEQESSERVADEDEGQREEPASDDETSADQVRECVECLRVGDSTCGC